MKLYQYGCRIEVDRKSVSFANPLPSCAQVSVHSFGYEWLLINDGGVIGNRLAYTTIKDKSDIRKDILYVLGRISAVYEMSQTHLFSPAVVSSAKYLAVFANKLARQMEH